ncbi:putative disease resistance protein RGA4 [Carex rostrata]
MDPVSITLTAVGWLMSSLVEKAVTAMIEAWAKRTGRGNEFKTLKRQLLQLGSLLTSARIVGKNNSFLEELVQDLQQHAYQAENLLDELDYYRLEDEIQHRDTQEKVNCSNKSSAASSSSGFRLASRSILSTLKGMSCCSARDALISKPDTSSQINLSKRMKVLAEQLQKSEEEVRNAVQTELLVINAHNTEIIKTEAANLPQTSPFDIETREVVGRDEERDQLLNLLTNEESVTIGKVLVLAIVGGGGVGKTTLAGLVFNDPNVKSCFDVRSWICVSTRFEIVRLTREMLESTCGDRYDRVSNLGELQKQLKDKLESRRFLLVLDDMWEDKDKSQWDKMIALLNNCMVKRGIILVTTRNQSVVQMIDARDISLRRLDEDVFLSFFSTCIFNDPNYGGNWRLKNIGQQIAKKLKGNPLAAKTVSALLKKNPDERYWMKIRDSEEWKTQSGQNQIMPAQSGQNEIMPALRLSYEHMPFHLQRCFSYCAIFPEDHPFTCEELVYQWMAQGYLNVRFEGERMEDIGRAYFNDLFNRGFFQIIQSRRDNEVHYTFHDFIHDLAHMVAFKECLTINGPKSRQIPPTIRHLSIFNSKEMAKNEEAIVTTLECLKGKNLSTIFNLDKLPSRISCSILDLLKENKFLRAVRLDLCGPVQLHNCNFHNFVSLRYLRLIMSDFDNCKTLPREICRLYHLEVLEIKDGRLLDELPNNFSDLVSLRHFIVEEGLDSENPLHSKIWGVGKLTSLQELNHFDVQQKKGYEIEELGSLKEIGGLLKIRNLDNVKSKEEANEARLAEKEKLDALYLKWNHGEQENENVIEGLKPNTNLKSLGIDGYGGMASPRWLDLSLIFLESLTLKGCKAWDQLPPIGELEFLKNLELSGMAVREIGPQCYGTRQSMKFSSLEKLKIIEMPNLQKWMWNAQFQQFLCFKKLRELQIRNCTKLVDFPLSKCATSEVLKRFPSLVIFEIDDCPLILQIPPLPYSYIHIGKTGFIESMLYRREFQEFSLDLDKCSSLTLFEQLAVYELSSLRSLKISNISNLESLDLHCFVALEKLDITCCQSLTSLTFGEHLVHLKTLKIKSCKTLSSMEGLKYLVKLKRLHFQECPGFIAAWDTASKEIEITEPGFSLSVKRFKGDSLGLLTFPICQQLKSLERFMIEVSASTEEDEVSMQLLTSIDLVDVRGWKKNLQSFPFFFFPSLEILVIKFPHINSLSIDASIEITEECLKLRKIKEVLISTNPVQITLSLSSEPIQLYQLVEEYDSDDMCIIS